jgi:hypothetical protein
LHTQILSRPTVHVGGGHFTPEQDKQQPRSSDTDTQVCCESKGSMRAWKIKGQERGKQQQKNGNPEKERMTEYLFHDHVHGVHRPSSGEMAKIGSGPVTQLDTQELLQRQFSDEAGHGKKCC